MIELLFWLSALAIVYAYAGYPLALALLTRYRSRPYPVALIDETRLPGISLIVPVHNERANIEAKLRNVRELAYPAGLLQTIFVSDGSDDGTDEVIRREMDERITLVTLPARGGKAAALNAGLARALHDIVVFSDASIIVSPDALQAIVAPFDDPEVGCVSGEDHIAQPGGEGLYGRYELHLRRQESKLHSIVGASGSFYAQRRELCESFEPNLAPDFLSVLRTVTRGYRAVSQPRARGRMAEVGTAADEFRRKVRTILRGITTLSRYRGLLNPFRHGLFAFELVSHKLARWLVPFFLLLLLASNFALAADSSFYRTLLALQLAFYGLAVAALSGWGRLARSLPVRVSVYFATVNLATLSAWLKYIAGARQEFWSPSRR